MRPLMTLSALSIQALTMTAPVSRADDAGPELLRGVNASHWFSQTTAWDMPPGALREVDVNLIRACGLDHIRLPVDPARLSDSSHALEFSARNAADLDNAIRLILAAGLDLVVDLHPQTDFKKRIQEDPLALKSLIAFWSRLAAHLSTYPPDRVALEIMNEPLMMEPAEWRVIQYKLYRAIRKVAPEHLVVLCGGAWSDISALLEQEVLGDSRTMYTFHFYEPHVFTHQGARWGMPEWRELKRIPYPLALSNAHEALEERPGESAMAMLEREAGSGWNRETITDRIQEAVAWARSNEVRIWCGEFGVLRLHAPSSDRLEYLRDVRQALERHGIGWCMWDYRGGFALIEKEEGSTIPKVNPQTRSALGLGEDKDESDRTSMNEEAPD